MFRVAASSASRRVARGAPIWSHARLAHNLRALPYSVDDGLGKFLPADALRTIAVDYQEGLLQRLNEEVAGDAQLTGKSVADAVIQTAPDRTKSKAFMYASQALNNSFFLDHLAPLPSNQSSHEIDLSSDLAYQIRAQFGSLDEMKSMVGATASGMSGGGYVWLVADGKGDMAVLPTFGSGTLLVRSRRQHQAADGTYLYNGKVVGETMKGFVDTTAPLDAVPAAGSLASSDHAASSASTGSSTPTSPTSGLTTPSSSDFTPPPGSRAMHSSAVRHSLPTFGTSSAVSSVWERDPGRSGSPGGSKDLVMLGDVVYPLFCLSAHERCWMSAGFGVWGRDEWIRHFWSVLNWKKISETHARLTPGQRY